MIFTSFLALAKAPLVVFMIIYSTALYNCDGVTDDLTYFNSLVTIFYHHVIGDSYDILLKYGLWPVAYIDFPKGGGPWNFCLPKPTSK